MKFKKKAIAKALAAKGMTAYSLKSVAESTAYRAKNGKPISAVSAKKIAEELNVELSSLIDMRG